MSDRRLAELRRRAPGDEQARHALQRGLVRAGRALDEAWGDLPLRLAGDPTADPRLTEAGREALRDDLWNLAAERLVRHFPRDAQGRLERLSLPLLLAEYPAREALPAGRTLWLVAAPPARRRDPQQIALRLSPRIGSNHARSWADLRCLWDLRVELTEARLWGAQGVLELVRAGELPGLGSLPERIARAVLLLDAGRILEGLGEFGVEVDDRLASMLAGFVGPWGRPEWPERTRAALSRAAVWRLPALVEREEARLAAWRAERKGRRRKPARLRLLALPRQREQAKLSLVLARAGDAVRLELERTGSSARCPEDLWSQPPRIDVLPEPPAPSAETLRRGRQVEVLKAVKREGLHAIVRGEGLPVERSQFLHQYREAILRCEVFSLDRALLHLDVRGLQRICRALGLDPEARHKGALRARILQYAG